ncbi:MAG: PepSY domain-containing protein [Pseudomonadota bacterium]
MMKWIPGLLLAAALSLHSAQAKESRGSSTTSVTKSSSTNNSTTSSSTSSSSSTHSRFDQDDAREALKKGKVMPLTAILDIAAKRQPGGVIAVDLETHKGRLIYEIDVITDDGRRRELRLDARSGEILAVEDD